MGMDKTMVEDTEATLDITREELMSRLAQHKSVSTAPVGEHEWLAANGTLRKYSPGHVVTAKGDQAKKLLIVLTGNIVIRMDRGAGSHKIFEWNGGDVGGVMPYSRVQSPPNDVVVEEPSEVLVIPRDKLPEMIRECPVITAKLVHAMVDRARQFTTSDLRDEKLISLGKLAAGLAHELNNPASAVMRSSKTLSEALKSADEAGRQLAAAHLSDSQFAAIESTRTVCGTPHASLSAIERADHEDEIANWLADHDADEECALPLADTGVTLAALDTLAANLDGDALDAALRWISASCLLRALSSEIETASSRMYNLVAAVKGFSYMDHAPTPEPVDIRRGIADTLTVLGAKTRSKSVQVSMDIPDDLPHAHAVGAELNQVWMNLIDNALDAVAVGGRVAVTAGTELESVVVRITDDGPGIPKEIQQRIFEPFFTTKGVGKGTGLGLDVVRRLLQRHEGGVSVESEPGRTEFQVRLPAEK
jgi:signal transduction histidine kinase